MTNPAEDDLNRIVDSELARGNVVSRGWLLEQGPHAGYVTLQLRHPLDLEAIRAEFELLASIELRGPPGQSETVIVDWATGYGVVGGRTRRGRRATRQLEQWWAQWTADPRPRIPICGPLPGAP